MNKNIATPIAAFGAEAQRLVAQLAAALLLVVSMASSMSMGQAQAAEPKVAVKAKSAAKVDATIHSNKLPRTTGGKPDLSGIWQTLSTADWDIEPHQARKDAPAGVGVVVGNVIPYQAAALLKRKENFEKRAVLDPRAKCFMPGIPRATYTPLPFQIFQSDQQLTLLYEYAHTVRTIYTNGSKHPDGHIDWWMGDSRGHWEGDTLVVDVTHFNDESWFDRSGNFHSDALHVVERYQLIDIDHIQYEATIEDANVFTRPWSLNLILYRHKEKNFQLLEYECYAFDFEKYYP